VAWDDQGVCKYNGCANANCSFNCITPHSVCHPGGIHTCTFGADAVCTACPIDDCEFDCKEVCSDCHPAIARCDDGSDCLLAKADCDNDNCVAVCLHEGSIPTLTWSAAGGNLASEITAQREDFAITITSGSSGTLDLSGVDLSVDIVFINTTAPVTNSNAITITGRADLDIHWLANLRSTAPSGSAVTINGGGELKVVGGRIEAIDTSAITFTNGDVTVSDSGVVFGIGVNMATVVANDTGTLTVEDNSIIIGWDKQSQSSYQLTSDDDIHYKVADTGVTGITFAWGPAVGREADRGIVYDVDGNKGTIELPVTITAAAGAIPITDIDGLVLSSQEYNGTNEVLVPATFFLPLLSNDVEAGDEVHLLIAAATYDNANAGDDKPVTITSWGLFGIDAAKYDIDIAALNIIGSITPKPFEFTDITTGQLGDLSRNYNGTTQYESPPLNINDNVKVPADQSSLTLFIGLSGNFTDRNAGLNKTVTITDGISHCGNYALIIPTVPAQRDTIQVTINPLLINVAVDGGSTKAFGMPDAFTHDLTADELVPADQANFNTIITGSLGRVPGESPDTYAINIGTLSAGSNYELDFTSSDLTINKANITDPDISIVYPTTVGVPYGTRLGDIPLSGGSIIDNRDGRLPTSYAPLPTGTFAWQNANVYPVVGEHTSGYQVLFTPSPVTDVNYDLGSLVAQNVTINVTKAAAPVGIDQIWYLEPDEEDSFDLSTLWPSIAPLGPGTTTYTIGASATTGDVFDTAPATSDISGNTLSLTAKDDATGIVTIPITIDSANFEPFDAVIEVRVLEAGKTALTVDFDVGTGAPYIYTGANLALINLSFTEGVNDRTNDVDDDYEVIITKGDDEVDEIKDAGTYSVTVRIEGSDDYVGERTRVITVAPAPATITATINPSTIALGQPAPTNLDYTVMLTNDNLEEELTEQLDKGTTPTVSIVGFQRNVPGEFPVVASGANAGPNFTFTYVPTTLTVQGVGSGHSILGVTSPLSGFSTGAVIPGTPDIIPASASTGSGTSTVTLINALTWSTGASIEVHYNDECLVTCSHGGIPYCENTYDGSTMILGAAGTSTTAYVKVTALTGGGTSYYRLTVNRQAASQQSDSGGGGGGGGGSSAPAAPAAPSVNYGTSAMALARRRTLNNTVTRLLGASDTPFNHVVRTGRTVVVPTTLLDTLRGTPGTVMMNTGTGVTYSVSGANIPTGETAAIDLSLRTGRLRAPSEVVSAATSGSRTSVQIPMASRDAFGFTVNMHFNFGAATAGRSANLFRFNEATGQFEYLGSFEINERGQAMFGIGEGADYLVTVTDTAPDLPIVRGMLNVGSGPATGTVHTVAPGETMSRIAQRYGITLARLRELNPGIANINFIRVGQTIRVG
jgi:LysM repeat protein